MTIWLIYAIVCMILWGLWGLILKLAYKEAYWNEVYFISSIASFLIALTVFLMTHGKLSFKVSSLYALFAGIFGGVGYIFFIKSLEHGKASIVIPLTALYPAITVILAFLVLHEKLTITQVLGIALAIIAVILLSI